MLLGVKTMGFKKFGALTILVSLFFITLTVSGNERPYSSTVREFISAVKTKDPDIISFYISFPLRRQAPVPPIINKQQFIKRFDEVFDNTLMLKIINSDPDDNWSQMGSQGIMLGNGDIWLDDLGHLIALNIQSEKEAKLNEKFKVGLERSIDKEFDYGITDMKFFTSEGEIPNGCFGQLMTELNGDNSVAAIFINRASLRGCSGANRPYPGGEEDDISYEINQALDDHVYRLTVCEVVHGSIGASCDRILVKFVNRDYVLGKDIKQVLALEKVGEW
jgi:hypothetical protein